MTTEVFPGMESLYRSQTANDAVTIARSIDKQPSDLMNWVHWNNASIFACDAMQRGTTALTLADRSVESRYRDSTLIVLDAAPFCSFLQALPIKRRYRIESIKLSKLFETGWILGSRPAIINPIC